MPSTATSPTLRALIPRWTEYIPHTPHPRQHAFCLLPHDEALFGGAAGGGKTDALLMAALQYVDVPGYAALLLRRTFRQLSMEESLLDRAAEWLSPTAAKWSGKDYRWTFPSGATLSFGYLDRDDDRWQYQSAAFQYVGFDELTQWRNDIAYRYLFSRLRRLDTPEMRAVPLRMRAATNPGGLGHDWVKARFIDPNTRERSAVFLQSLLHDNPSLDAASYVKGLEKLDPITRAHLLAGRWDIRPMGNMLKREWFRLDVEAPSGLSLCRFWDLAATEPHDGNKDPDWTVGALVGLDDLGNWWVLDIQRVRLSSHLEVAR